MSRFLFAIACVAAVSVMSVQSVAATPTPSPTLDGLLVSPGTGYVELDRSVTGALEGPFDAAGYVAFSSPANPPAATTVLSNEGFISGYGRTWVLTGGKRVYIEAVIAFTGGKGAKQFLLQSEVADKANAHYKSALSVTGIDTYYGAHDADPTNHLYVDAFVFAKGNDIFLLAAVSSNDDLGSSAGTQTKRLYDAAPAYTIPPSQWPSTGSTSTASLAFNIGQVFGALLIGAVVLGLILLVVGLVLRSRRRAPQPVYGMPAEGQPAYEMPAAAQPGYGIPAAAQPGYGIPAAAQPGYGIPAASQPARPAPAAVQLSPDGKFWWDGTTWRDAAIEVPPTAQRSSDGHFWWDGQSWRPVP